jgi:hypothetical protein
MGEMHTCYSVEPGRTWEERIKQELKVNYMYVSFAAKNTHTLVQTQLSVSLKQVELIMNCT